MNVYIIFLLNLILKPGQYIVSGAADIAITWLGFHLSLLGMMYIVINTFRYYLNRGEKIVTWLNKCSFGVYVVHFIAMGAAGTVLLHSAMPSLVKYGLLTLITFAASNLMVSIYHLGVHGVRQLKTDTA
jgi:predicted anti-sigma-YlaC factor YlaD